MTTRLVRYSDSFTCTVAYALVDCILGEDEYLGNFSFYRMETYYNARAAIRSRTKKTVEDIDKLLQRTPKHWNLRKARVILNQLYTRFCAPFLPMRRILRLGQEKCRQCNEEETVQHFFTRVARERKRQAYFPDRT